MIWEGLAHFYDCLEEAEEHGLVVGLMENPRRNGKGILDQQRIKSPKHEMAKVWIDELSKHSPRDRDNR